MALVDPSWMPACDMRRIICHWTGGGYRASGLDRSHYHILIEGDGAIVKGLLSIADNVTLSGSYAKHTRGCNQNSIGVAVCCMFRARERPFRAGPAPMKELQFLRMANVAAELCARYGIAITPETVLGHGEVQENLGVVQDAKWDPLVLPWNLTLKKSGVGAYLRELVRDATGGGN